MGGTLHVITDRQWMREELASNTLLPTANSFGLDIPTFEPGDPWWIPQGMATRFLLSGVDFTFQAPGPRWAADLPVQFSGREIKTFDAATVLAMNTSEDSGAGHWKFAEAKVDTFQAAQHDLSEVQAYLHEHAVPATAVLQCSALLTLGNEYRFFIRDGKIATGSVYLTRKHGVELTYYDYADVNTQEYSMASDFLAGALTQLRGPAGYVIDVGVLTDGRPVILEANPAWCSAWYGCDIDEVVKTVVASCAPDAVWRWHPDAVLVERYQRYRPLRGL